MSERVYIAVKNPEAKRTSLASKVQKPDSSQSNNSPVDHILYLQKTIGNQAVQRLFKSGVIQAKLKIGKPNDIYEQEADRVTDIIMQMPEPRVFRQPEEEEELIQPKPIAEQITPLVQRQVEPEEKEEEKPVQTKPLDAQVRPLVQRQIEEEERKKREEEEEEPIQTKGDNSSTAVATPGIESNVNSLKGGGQPLPKSVRNYFEPRFGADFSAVKVHTGEKASSAAKAVNAHAFTISNSIVFNAGNYSPKTKSGKKLLTHELAHVVQQRDGDCLLELQRKEGESPGITFDLEFDLEVILGPKPKEQSVSINQQNLLELYQYLKYIRKHAPELEQQAKCLLEVYFTDYGDEVWETSKKPFAGYMGTRYLSKKRMEEAQRLGLQKTERGRWSKKFLGSDVIFFSGHHYGSGELDYLDITDLRIRRRPAKFERVKLIMISSCNVLNRSNLSTWRRRFPNAYILGWYGSAPYRQSNMMMKFLSKLPEDLIFDDPSNMEKVIKLWEAFIENLEDENVRLLTSEKRKASKWGLGHATPDGTVKFMGRNRRGDWVWRTRRRKRK